MTGLAGRIGVRYGPTRAERVDIFPAGEGAPVHIFIHGGYWRRFAAADFFVRGRGAGRGRDDGRHRRLRLVPRRRPSTRSCARCRAAIAWTWTNASTFGGDRDRITLSGHSAGGHLTAMALATDWPGAVRPAARRHQGRARDQRPVRPGTLPLQLAPALPPAHLGAGAPAEPDPLLPGTSPPLAVAVGADESAEFRRQASTFHALRAERGLPGRHSRCRDATTSRC